MSKRKISPNKRILSIGTTTSHGAINESESQLTGTTNKTHKNRNKCKSELVFASERENLTEKKRIVLEMQRTAALEQNAAAANRQAAAANKQAAANRHAAVEQNTSRSNLMTTWSKATARLTRELKKKKKQFDNHCKNHEDTPKRSAKQRQKEHQQCVASRGDDFDSDYDDRVESDVLNEIDELEVQLERAKKELDVATNWENTDGDNGSSSHVNSDEAEK